MIVAHENTCALVAGRGRQDWESEFDAFHAGWAAGTLDAVAALGA